MHRTPIVVALLVLTVIISAPVRGTDKPKNDSDREKIVQITQGELDDLRAENAALKELVREEMIKRWPRNATTGEIYGQDRLEQALSRELDSAKSAAHSPANK